MVLLLTSEVNHNILQDYLKEAHPDWRCTKENCTSLEEYLKKKKNFKHYMYIVLDLAVLTETSEEFINSLLRFKLLAGENVRIIILALNYKSGQIINELIKNQFYNIIIGETTYIRDEQIRNCFSEQGTLYTQIAKYYNQKQESKFSWNNFFANIISLLKAPKPIENLEEIILKGEEEISAERDQKADDMFDGLEVDNKSADDKTEAFNDDTVEFTKLEFADAVAACNMTE